MESDTSNGDDNSKSEPPNFPEAWEAADAAPAGIAAELTEKSIDPVAAAQSTVVMPVSSDVRLESSDKSESSAEKSGAPGINPESPVGTSESPVGKSESPGIKPESPVGTSESPVGTSESQVGKSESPGIKPESPVGTSKSPGIKPESPGIKPESPVGISESPGINAGSPLLLNEQLVGKAVKTGEKSQPSVGDVESPVGTTETSGDNDYSSQTEARATLAAISKAMEERSKQPLKRSDKTGASNSESSPGSAILTIVSRPNRDEVSKKNNDSQPSNTKPVSDLPSVPDSSVPLRIVPAVSARGSKPSAESEPNSASPVVKPANTKSVSGKSSDVAGASVKSLTDKPFVVPETNIEAASRSSSDVKETRVETVMVEPVRVEPVRVEPVRVEPVRVEPVSYKQDVHESDGYENDNYENDGFERDELEHNSEDDPLDNGESFDSSSYSNTSRKSPPRIDIASHGSELSPEALEQHRQVVLESVKARAQEAARAQSRSAVDRSWLAVIITAVVAGAIGAMFGSTMSQRVGSSLSPSDMQTTSSGHDFVAVIADRVMPTVVNISVGPAAMGDTDQGPKIATSPEQQALIARQMHSLGAGVVIRSDGYVVTSAHVVRGQTNPLFISLSNGSSFRAKVVGKDPFTDIAVVKIDSSNLPVAKFAADKSTRPGDWAIAIGTPLGFDHSVSLGVVSAIGRSIADLNNHVDLIQTDAAMNPGNSGGPLFNSRGEVIGINAVIRGGAQNIGFAVPSEIVKWISGELIAHGDFKRPYIGIVMAELTPEGARQLGIDRGVVVTDVVRNSPCDRAGLSKSDVIIKLNGRDVNNIKDARETLKSRKPGDVMQFVFSRKGIGEQTRNVLVGEFPYE